MEMKKQSKSPSDHWQASLLFRKHHVIGFWLDKDMVNRYPVENDDESKRSNGYHEQNLSSMVYTTPDIKYTSF